jgi:hypothetical protein
MKYPTALIALALTLAGCSKHSSNTAATSKTLTLGVVEVSDGIQSRYDLGDGKVCILTPTIQKDGGVVLEARFEEAGKLLESPRPRIQTVSGQPARFFFGNISFELTPHIKERAAHIEERQSADDKEPILPGRHLSESQVADIAFKELPPGSSVKCEFKAGVWEILAPQRGVWGVSSRTTNTDGKITIESTNATRVVLRVRDSDGKVEPVKTP